MKKLLLKNISGTDKKNTGSTMVEVLAGVTILVMIIVECMVHLVGLSGELIKKSRDISEDMRTVNREMYKKSADFVKISDTSITLTLDESMTDTGNMADYVSLNLNADIYRYYNDEAGIAVFRISKK